MKIVPDIDPAAKSAPPSKLFGERSRAARRLLSLRSQKITSPAPLRVDSPKSFEGGAGAFLIATILALVPFHAFLSVWIGSAFGVYEAARLWEEALLVLLAVFAGLLVWRDKALRARLKAWPLFWLIASYAVLHVIMSAVALASDHVSLQATLYGLTVNVRFVLFFLLCAVVAAKSPWLRQNWPKLLFVPASVVVGFGLLQAFVLPHDVLKHVGYGPHTIPAYQAVDLKEQYARVQSTMRGPNPLGAYLMLVIAGVLAALLGGWRKFSWWWRVGFGGLLVGAIVVLGYSFSRSAYIGAALAAGLVGWLFVSHKELRRWLLVAAAGLLLVGGVSVVVLRQNDLAQNVLFHTSERSTSPHSSNQDRAQALEDGLHDLAHEPLGRGPGSAGPASVYNNGRVRLAENYYLQIGQEVGWLGFGLFMAIILGTGWQLLQRRSQPLVVALFASLIGIGLVGLLSHVWADDTISLLWWGLAGVAILDDI